MSEEQLVQRARAGDSDAWERLFDRHRDRVFRLAYRMTGQADTAEDVVQDAFLGAMRKARGLRNGQAFEPWLLRIATRLCLDVYRRRGSLNDTAPLPDLPAEGTPESVAVDEARRQEVQAALATVPSHHRILLVLRDIEDLSYQEIAEVLGCSTSSVKVRLTRARAVFRQRAQHLLEDGSDGR